MSTSLPSPLRTAVLAVLLSSLALGWCIVELNMMTGDRALRGTLQLDTFEITACTAVLYVGAGFSALFCHFPSEHFGRRATLLACDVLFIAGSLLCVASNSVTLIFVGRTVIGVGAGAALTVVPALLAEIAPAPQRGVVGFAHTCAITLGSWLCAICGSCLVTYVDGGWRGIFLGLWVFGTLQLLLAHLVPESPRWLARQRGVAAALHMLGTIRPKGTPEAKLLLEIPPDDGGQSATVSPDELRALSRPISIGSTLLVMQALSGINVVTSYSTSIFKAAGVRQDGFATSIVLGVCFVSTAAASRAIDRFGRRTLLLASCAVMATGAIVTGACLASAGTLAWSTAAVSVASVLGVSTFYAGYALGLGPVPWVLAAEIFENRLRARALAYLSALNLWANATIIFGASYLINALAGCALDARTVDDDHPARARAACTEGRRERGAGLLLLAFAACIGATAVFVHSRVVETKGLTLEELERQFSSRRSPATPDDDEPRSRDDAPLLASESA